MKLILSLTSIAVYLLIAVSGEIIHGQYVISFDNHCLAVRSHSGDAIRDFFSVFTCYGMNTQSVDLYPNIGDYFMVVNKDPFCHDDKTIEDAIGDFCINNIEPDAFFNALASYRNSDCECKSRNVDPIALYNLDSLTPQVENGFEFMKCSSRFDPGFDIIVMDGGINGNHEEFNGITFRRIFNAYPDEGINLQYFGWFHGTMVAGIIVGNSYGAFAARNTPVKLLNVKFTDEWGRHVTMDRRNGYKAIIDYLQKNPTRKAIVNMSFGVPNSAVDDWLIAMIRKNGGIIFTSAGNAKMNACEHHPASSSNTVTVGAVNRNFERWISSNFGECVTIWAPGADITSANSTGGTATKSGTSLAAPLVAGVAANILIGNPQFSFDDIKGKLLSIFGAEYDVIFDRPDGSLFPTVRNQPRIQGSCELYAYGLNAYGYNRPVYSGHMSDGYGYRGYGNTEYDNKYEKNANNRNGYVKGEKRKYDRKRYGGKRYGNTDMKNVWSDRKFGHGQYDNNQKYRA